VHFVTPVSSIEAQQLVNRWRDQAPSVLWYNAGRGKLYRADLEGMAAQFARRAREIADDLNRLGNRRTEDALEAEAQQSYLAAARRLPTWELVEHNTDFDDDGKEQSRWEPSAVGVNNAFYRNLKTAENRHPELFMRHTGAYGWEWGSDLERVCKPVQSVKVARRVFVAEKEEERRVYLGMLAEQMKKLGERSLIEALRSRDSKLDNDYRRMGKIALSCNDVNGGAFDKACDAAVVTLGQTRRARDMRRRLHVQTNREQDAVALWFYNTHLIGDRLTPEDMQIKLQELFGQNPHAAVFAKTRVGIDETISARKAVAIYSDFFTLKRCKIRTPDGERVNGYDFIADAGSVSGEDVRHFLAGLPVSLNFCNTHDDNSETDDKQLQSQQTTPFQGFKISKRSVLIAAAIPITPAEVQQMGAYA